MVGKLADEITCAKFQDEFLGVTILQGVAFPIFLLIFAWALHVQRDCAACDDVVSCKDVPFGGPKNKVLHFHPIFPQNANFSTIFDGTLKFSRQKGLNNGDAGL